MSSRKVIIHDGTFHLDEILAVSVLSLIYNNIEIIRTRDIKLKDQPDIFAVADVFGIYDPQKNYFDHHHQRGFFETFDENTKVKLSSSGLVYKHFGKDLLKKFNISEKYFLEIYNEYFMFADGIDNGYDIKSEILIENEYHPVAVRSLTCIVRLFNNNDDFSGAFKLVKADLERFLKNFSKQKEKIEDIEKCMDEQDGDILVLNVSDRSLDLVCECEKRKKDFKYIVVKEENWRVYAVKCEKGSFKSKMAIYQKWQGLRNEELQKESGIKDAIFVHASGFLGVCESFEGAMEMAKKSLQLCKKNDQE